MYDNLTTLAELRDRLALVDEQRRIAVDQLESTRSELRLEKERASGFETEVNRLRSQIESDTAGSASRQHFIDTGEYLTANASDAERLREQVELFARQKAADDERIAALIREKTEAEVLAETFRSAEEQARRDLQAAKIRHDNDVATIGERLLEEAERRSWCSEFDDFVAEINSTLHVELPRRIKDFDVYVPVQVMVRVSVSAFDEQGAEEEAGREWRDRWDGEYAVDIINEGSTVYDGEFKVEEID